MCESACLLYALVVSELNLTASCFQVLVIHLIWVISGVHILGVGLRPFFNKKKSNWIKLYWKKQVIYVCCALYTAVHILYGAR